MFNIKKDSKKQKINNRLYLLKNNSYTISIIKICFH